MKKKKVEKRKIKKFSKITCEKIQKENPVGYEAKLKNAKLSYYKGNFSLAQSHLDILKEATTRERGNMFSRGCLEQGVCHRSNYLSIPVF